LPKDLVWFTTNASVDHPNIKALPIGITDYCGYSPYRSIIGDSRQLKNYIDAQPRTEKNLVLMNFNDNSNALHRSLVRLRFQNKEFVTVDKYSADEVGYMNYVQSLRSHPFCLAPRGNGIDTHRMWESLYAGCIPIVQKARALRDFNELPIFFVDRWEDACDESVLKDVRDQYYERKWDLRKLTLSYWYQHIYSLAGYSLAG
jgi:Exostosin family